MTRLPSCTATQVIRTLQRAGWQLKRPVGSPQSFKHPEKSGLVVVPFHRGDLKRGTLHEIIRHAGLPPDEFIKLLRG
jgi:predicted RNA binding protein YcfA (HicA-like mRNA interferase family)